MTAHLLSRTAQADCTKDTCPASASIYGYAPGFESTVVFIGSFALSTIIYYHQSFVWPKWRLYSLLMAFGCLMESAGYGGRLMLHNDPFSKFGFKINVILLTIAPAFLSAGLYVMLKRLVILFGPQYSRISPNAYAYIFVSSDALSIILQGAGGSISAVAKDKTFLDQGVDIMIAGLVSQVFTLMIFAGLCVDFARQVKQNYHLLPPARQRLTRSLRFKFVTAAMSFAFLCILIRCAYRVAELSQGWGSEMMRKEEDFIIMDSIMCLAAAFSLNIFHPGYSLPEPEETPNERAEQVQSREKIRGYSVMKEDLHMKLAPPAPMFANTADGGVKSNNLCPRCACWEDRRSWI